MIVDMTSITFEDIPKLRQIIAKNTEDMEKMREFISGLQNSDKDSIAPLSGHATTQIAAAQSIIDDMELENTLANEMVQQAETHVTA